MLNALAGEKTGMGENERWELSVLSDSLRLDIRQLWHSGNVKGRSAEFSFRECGDSPAVISAAAEELFGVCDLGFVGQRWENLRERKREMISN